MSTLISCSEGEPMISKEEVGANADKRVAPADPDCGCGGGWVWTPDGSRGVKGDHSMEIIPPVDWTYIGQGADGIMVKGGRATISCTCTKGSGCSPYSASAGGQSFTGCNLSSKCTECKAQKSIANTVLAGGGFINRAVGVRYARNGEKLPSIFDEMFMDTEVTQALEAFLQNELQGASTRPLEERNGEMVAPDGYTVVVLNVMGRGLVTAFPNDKVPNEIAARMMGGGKASCSCTDGTCTLQTKSIPFVGAGSSCEASSCKGKCTLSTKTAHGANVNEIMAFKF